MKSQCVKPEQINYVMERIGVLTSAYMKKYGCHPKITWKGFIPYFEGKKLTMKYAKELASKLQEDV